MTKLTDAYLKALRPKAKPYKSKREGGLFVLVPPGGSRLWRLAYSFGGKEKLVSLGVYPAVTLADARERRDDARKLLAAGVDPSVHRQIEKARVEVESVNTFRAIADEWLVMKADSMAEITANKARWMLDFVLPELGPMPLASIQPPDVLRVLREVEKTGKSETVHRLKARVSEIFRFAVATGRATSDPTRDLRGALKPKRATKHHAALTDPKEVGALLRAMDGYQGTPEVHAALKLAPLLFVRPGELRTAQWPQFDLEGEAPTWKFVAAKTRTAHIVPLAPQVVEILTDLHRLTSAGVRGKPEAPKYLFPGGRSRLAPMSENAVTAALRNLGYTGDQMTGHGFRATARTLLAELGWHTDAIERQLAHKPSGPLGAAYDRAQFLQERRRMMNAWADYLDSLKKGASNVVPIRAA